MTRERLLSVTIHDCEVQTFRSGGAGGQNQNKRDTGVRIIHHPSGARGESREERSQLQNKKAAWRRMAESPKFDLWLKKTLGKLAVEEEAIELKLADYLGNVENDIKVEVKEDGRWVPATKELA